MQYTEEQIEQLRIRWYERLIDPETGKPIIVEGCKTFQELLAKRLIEIEEVLMPEIEKVDVSLGFYNKRREYKKIWERISKKKIHETIFDFIKYSLEDPKKLQVYLRGYYEIYDNVTLDEYLSRDYPIDLRGANLEGRHFEGANLRGAHFEGAHCKNAHFNNASCIGAYFDGADCEKASFYGANCKNAHFKGADCIETHFEGADCRYAHFDGADCGKAHFDNARCNGISFGAIEKIDKNRVIHREPCVLTGVTYKGADFVNVDTSNVDWSKNPGMKSYIEHQQFVHYTKLKAKSKFEKFLFKLWGKTSNYGTSIWKWLESCFRIIVIFAVIYNILDYSRIFPNGAFEISDKIANTPLWFSHIYFSVVTFSTLGFGDVTPIHWVSMILVMLEVFTGYFMLGGLITFLVKWLGRK